MKIYFFKNKEPRVRQYYCFNLEIEKGCIIFWPTVLSVEPMVQYVVCLSVCRLSVCLSATFCIVAKRCVLAKKCLKE